MIAEVTSRLRIQTRSGETIERAKGGKSSGIFEGLPHEIYVRGVSKSRMELCLMNHVEMYT